MNRLLQSMCSLLLPLMILIMGGNAWARNYVAVVPTYGWIAFVYDMDDQGHLTYRTTVPSTDSAFTDVSYDNRMIAMTQFDSGFTYVLFDAHGVIQHEGFVMGQNDPYLAWSTFAPNKRLFFTGTPLDLSIYRYDESVTSLTLVDNRKIPLNLIYKAYSAHANCLYFVTLISELDHSWRAIQGLKLASDDTYDTMTTKTINGQQSSIGLYVSHDGRTLASIGDTPALKVYRVQRDASLQLVQDWDLQSLGLGSSVLFSPDDRWAYLVGERVSGLDYDIATSFAVDPDTGRFTEVQRLTKYDWPGNPPDNIWINYYTSSISPDGRFLLIPYRLSGEQISRIRVIRLTGPTMVPLPIQDEIQTPYYYNTSGIAMFNANATEPTWAQYE